MSDILPPTESKYISNILNQDIPPRIMRKIKTGIRPIDNLLGGGPEEYDESLTEEEDYGGIEPGTVILFTGCSGGGKSTMINMMADSITGYGKAQPHDRFIGGIAHVNQTEQVKTDIAKRLQKMGLENGFSCSNFEYIEELFDYLLTYHIQRCPDGVDQREFFPKHEVTLFVDSLAGLKMENVPGGKRRGDAAIAVDVAKQLIKFAKQYYVTTFILNHVSKSGAAGGRNTLVHDVDAHLHLSKKLDKETKQSYFVAEMLKNRVGPTGVEWEYRATKRGIDWYGIRGGATSEHHMGNSGPKTIISSPSMTKVSLPPFKVSFPKPDPQPPKPKTPVKDFFDFLLERKQ